MLQVEAKSKKESVKLWNEMVNLSARYPNDHCMAEVLGCVAFTQATVAMYAVSLQEFLRRLQV